jgi:putative flippase GtrA
VPVYFDRCDVPPDTGTTAGSSAWALPLGVDLVVVLLFAMLGRLSHDAGNLVAGTLSTAAPFVLGLLAGWLRAPCAGLPSATMARSVRFGWWLLGWTMAGGVVLRALTGQGLAPAFLVVAAAVLAVGLVARRWIARWWTGRRDTANVVLRPGAH